MKQRKESSEHIKPQLEGGDSITAENRVTIEGYLKIALADLEEDCDQAQRVQAIAHILMPEKYALEHDNKGYREEVSSIKENYHNPADMINFLKKRQIYTRDDQQLGHEIRSIQSTILIQELKKLDPNHPLLLEFDQSQFAVKQENPESSTVPILNDSEDESHVESTAQVEISTDAVSADDILKRQEGFLPEVEEFMPIIWLQYPIGSPRMLYIYLKMLRIFSEFNLPSYKILDQEYNELSGLRGKFDNIFIYLTPHLSLEQVLLLMAVLGKPKTRSEEVFLHNIDFHFRWYRFTEVGNYRQNIDAALSKVQELKNHSLSLSYPYLFAMNCLLRHDLKSWNDGDVHLANRLITEFDRDEMNGREDGRGKLRLPSAELDLRIAKYYESKDRLKEAREYYYSANLRLVKIATVHIDGFNFDPFDRDNFKLTVPPPMSAKRLSALIRCLDNLIIVALRLGDSVNTINDHIRSLNGYIDKLQQTEPLTVLTISKREEIPVLITSQENSKEILKAVKPMQKFPKSAFFTQQIQEGFEFNLMALLKLMNFPSSKIKHIKKNLVSGVEIYCENLEDGILLYNILLKIMADGEEKKYGGHLSYDKSECCVEITFKAYHAFIRCLEIIESISVESVTETQQSTDAISPETLRRILQTLSADKTSGQLTTCTSDSDLYGNNSSSSDEASFEIK
ncbi:MAG: hypothetical protein K2X50_01065 [Gammaproteobacteria bacterium]|nr:hypothetical protein [Gammaproteobacteria bacterium]